MKVKQQQVILVGTSVLLLVLLYTFGRTTPDHSPSDKIAPQTIATASFNIESFLSEEKKKLSASQQATLVRIENSVTRGDVTEQEFYKNQQLSAFWRDSARNFILYSFYLGKAAELEKSEKSLTFAARNFFDDMRSEQRPAIKTWKAQQAKKLFEKSLVINPANDSNTVMLGACYIFGNLSDNPMEGILKIRGVAEKDPANLYAQLMLGIGAEISGQYPKAIERLNKVVAKETTNVEAICYLAEAYELSGDKANAVKWYTNAKQLVKGSEFEKELAKKLGTLQ